MEEDNIDQAAMDLMDRAKVSVAAFTGMRQQFIDAGWSEEGAEQMVIATLHYARQEEG